MVKCLPSKPKALGWVLNSRGGGEGWGTKKRDYQKQAFKRVPDTKQVKNCHKTPYMLDLVPHTHNSSD